ncbi:Oxidoreductase molybdopterin binding domain-containing protein [Desulfacinum hydrothermale DSM 13146]|uniref:Oxidoreductase molybdopterin binding domain-containing protein n=1 Tax=Desulfacinum hydrothermale DSM 13146 TaxID=1121390 RepID=A0A1W1XHK1_9BACT|nr:molybdopterin-dependent oxidoreductase [Desulfacinum hydrothermale]SMC23430.1 Oxidoreductase molybdopterin binding domain-containing protein [Desulfacinum hydrothermale DSM 13146]
MVRRQGAFWILGIAWWAGAVLVASRAWANAPLHIDLYGNLSKGCRTEPLPVSLESLRHRWTTLETEDPNFPTQGPDTYRGVYLDGLLEEFGVAPDAQITLLAEDQYLVAMPRSRFAEMKAFLAFERGGKPIPPMTGGPIKIVFPRDSRADFSAYLWYVKAIWVGDACGGSLEVRDAAGRAHPYTFPTSKKKLIFKRIPTAVPKGYREGWASPPTFSQVSGLWLRDVLGGHPSGAYAVEFIPYVGKSLHLPWKLAERLPILIVNGCNGQPVPVAFGGPLWVLLPTAEYGELAQWVGETSALFFLKAVRLHP